MANNSFDSVKSWLDRGARPADEPLLLYVHTIDPHAPYTPTGEFRERFAPDVRDPELTDRDLAELAGLSRRIRERSPTSNPTASTIANRGQ